MSIFDLFKQIESENGSSVKITYIIAGLGNPGLEYAETRHNTGFMALDKIVKQNNISVKTMKFRSDCGDGMIGGTRCFLMKPATYMNNSGEAIAAAAEFYKIPSERIIVLYDDISLPPGKLRIRRKGSAGGHNGIKSIIQLLGTDEFPRIKIGVGAKPNPKYDLADWVLGKFTEDQKNALEPALENSVKAVELLVQGKIEQAMNEFSS
ncbi:MAG: aminoacyl-tRNA hydrolase [Ruminococcus sp.]|nr:aminoacyl-tRNA hydrolase [Ruminococcus sp.]